MSRWDSNPQSQQVSDSRLTSWTARPLGSDRTLPISVKPFLYSGYILKVHSYEVTIRYAGSLYAVNTGAADKSLSQPRWTQATTTEDFDVHISYF